MSNPIQEAIQLAIEKGRYDFELMARDGKTPTVVFSRSKFRKKNREVCAIYIDSEGEEYGNWVVFSEWCRNNKDRIFLDPLFWEALGKALGWTDEVPHTTNGYPWSVKGWQTYFHRFIDHLIEGKDAEEFFLRLIAEHTLNQQLNEALRS